MPVRRFHLTHSVAETMALYLLIALPCHLLARSLPAVAHVDLLGKALEALAMLLWLTILRSKQSLVVDTPGQCAPDFTWLDRRGIALVAGTIATGIGSVAVLALSRHAIDPSWAKSMFPGLDAVRFAQARWDKSALLWTGLTTIVVGPVGEEIFFRGILLPRFVAQSGAVKGILYTSLGFSLFHYNLNFIGTFFIGITLAILALRFQSIYPPLLLHAGYNFCVFLLKYGFGYMLTTIPAKLGDISYWQWELLAFWCGVAAMGYALHACPWKR